MYKELDGGEFLKEVGTDAQKWAQAFIEITGTDIDEGALIGWEYPSPYTGFAKAWEIQEDKIYSLEIRLEKSNKKRKQLRTHLNLAVEALEQIAATEKLTWAELEKLPYNWDIAQTTLKQIKGEK